VISHIDQSTVLYALALGVALRMGCHWALALNEDPTSRPGAVMIPITPFSRFLDWALSLAAGFFFVLAFRTYTATPTDHASLVKELLLGGLFVFVPALSYNSYLWLDDEAMHYRPAIGRIRTIPWTKLDHYEIKEVSTRNGKTLYYLFRSTDGETISIHRTIYDVNDLLRTIDAHKPIHEEPYRRS
jgi:hypothetical protein